MDQACVDTFLDDGWCLIGQLHRWLSKWPRAAYDRVELVDLIGQLQSLWAVEDDLELNRLARATLALEQVLERFCSRTLEFNAERLADVTSAIEVFQDLLLGFEATREEPVYSSLDPIIRLERHARGPHRSDIVQVDIDLNESATETSTTIVIADQCPGSLVVDNATLAPLAVQQTIDLPVIAMLEQFVAKLDDACHRLHARMLMDETPYVTTTSRLEQLSQATRDLVEQIARTVHTAASIVPVEFVPSAEYTDIVHGELPLLAVNEARPALTSSTDLPRLVDSTRETARLPYFDSNSLDLAVIQALPQKGVSPLATVCRPENQEQREGVRPRFESMPVIHPTALDLSPIKSRRILILEESLFYRHLVRIAVESAGYEPLATETIQEGVSVLESSADFCAVLVSSRAVSAMAALMESSRRKKSFKVVLLTTASRAEDEACEVDERVSISHPQRLVSILERMLGHSRQETRRPA